MQIMYMIMFRDISKSIALIWIKDMSNTIKDISKSIWRYI